MCQNRPCSVIDRDNRSFNKENSSVEEEFVTALISTEPFVPGEHNGWHIEGARRVLIAQPDSDLAKGDNPAERLEQLWADIAPHLAEVERLVVHFGAPKCTDLLDRLQRAETRDGRVKPEQLTFLLCNCDRQEKVEAIAKRGFAASPKLRVGCGVDAVSQMYGSLLDHGQLAMAS